MTLTLLLTFLSAQPVPELGVLPQELRLMEDPADAWVGRVGVGLSPDGLWLGGEALPHWGRTPERGFDPGLVAALEESTQAGRAASGDRRFVGELFVELEPETSFADLLVVLGSAERAGFAQARVVLRGDGLPQPFSTRVGVRPMGGRQIFRLDEGQWVEDAQCSAQGTPNERLLVVDSAAPASQWLQAVQAEQGAFRLAELEPESCI